MMLDVALLLMNPTACDDADGSLRLINGVMEAGFPLRVCTRIQELFALLGKGQKPMVVLDVGHSDNEADGFMLSKFIKSAFHCGVILFVGATSDDRIRGWSHGADICLSGPVPSAELIAALNALNRRLNEEERPSAAEPAPQESAEPTGHATLPPHPPHSEDDRPSGIKWALEVNGRRLRIPNGMTVALSSTESVLLTLLFRAPDHLLKRDDWNSRFAGTNLANAHRRIDVIISRLRRKVERADGDLPLYSCRGIGYHFSASCGIKGDT
jgi:DNA-binding response OmpR family regulator